MKTRMLEATNGFNHGKFLLGRFEEDEWQQRSAIDALPLVAARGWTRRHLWIADLQTGEGAIFLPGGYASADLEKHKIWVCPLFEPFLTWLYTQDLSDLDALPALVELTFDEAPAQMYGYRRPGPAETADI